MFFFYVIMIKVGDKMKKLLLFVLVSIMFLPIGVFAEEKVPIYVFRGEGCPHCEEALEYFDGLKAKYNFELITYEVWYDEDNQELLEKVAAGLGETASGVPYIVIGEKTFSGYAETYNAEIEAAIVAEGVNGNANDKVKKFITKEKEKSQVTTIVLSVLVIAGIVALIILGRKSAKQE